MSEPIGYNDDNFPPLPNEDAAWEKMNRLLDEDERKRRVLPFWLRFSALAMLLAGSIIGGYFIWNSYDRETVQAEREYGRQHGDSNTPEYGQRTTEDRPAPVDRKSATSTDPYGDGSADQVDRETIGNKIVSGDLNSDKTSASGTSANNKLVTNSSNTPKVVVNNRRVYSGSTPKAASAGIKNSIALKPKNVVKKAMTNSVRPSDKNDPAESDVTTDPDTSDGKVLTDDPQKTDLPKTAVDSSARSYIDTKKDTVSGKPETTNPSDTTKLKAAVADKKDKTRKKNPWSWSMGIMFQEPVAIGSQRSSDYNYMGKRSWVGDHLPGVYFSASKSKGTLSGQFNYRVPQPVEQVLFSQSTKYDPANTTLKTEKFSIEKLYYHQFAATGSYALHPRISAEIGGGYHLLAGAVNRRDLKTTEVITGNTTTYNELAPVKGYKDSFLFRSTASALAGINYHWKKIQVGIRYSFALQPFMRYTSPDGTVEDVRNNTLMLTARLRIWEMKRP